MRVAGVIPCHDHALWVGECLLSMAHQSVPPGLIVVVDDGSTDGSSEAVRAAASHCPVRVELIRSEKARGPAAARNAGMRAAWDRADVFALCDSDDVYLPGKIERSLRLLTPGVGMVYSDYETVNPEGLVLRQWKEPYSRARLMQECLPNSDSLIARDAIEKAGGFPEDQRVAEDFMVWTLMSKTHILRHLPECLVRIRVGPHSSSSTVPRERWNEDYAKVVKARG